MSGAIPPLPYTPSWRGAQLKHRENFTFTFFLYVNSILHHSNINSIQRGTVSGPLTRGLWGGGGHDKQMVASVRGLLRHVTGTEC
jgi:hypothetical protein